jgi:hypothetical protein
MGIILSTVNSDAKYGEPQNVWNRKAVNRQ